MLAIHRTPSCAALAVLTDVSPLSPVSCWLPWASGHWLVGMTVPILAEVHFARRTDPVAPTPPAKTRQHTRPHMTTAVALARPLIAVNMIHPSCDV